MEDGVPDRDLLLLLNPKEPDLVGGGGGARRPMMNVKKSSCWSFNSDRMVSNMVEIVRSVVCKTAELSDLASWKRYLHAWSRTKADKEGKSQIRAPATSKQTFSILSAVSRVESV